MSKKGRCLNQNNARKAQKQQMRKYSFNKMITASHHLKMFLNISDGGMLCMFLTISNTKHITQNYHTLSFLFLSLCVSDPFVTCFRVLK